MGTGVDYTVVGTAIGPCLKARGQAIEKVGEPDVEAAAEEWKVKLGVLAWTAANVAHAVASPRSPSGADEQRFAAAAWLAERGAGLIQADTEGWLKPTPKEVKRILAER